MPYRSLQVAAAVSIDDASAARIQQLEPRIQLLRDPSLTRPWRWHGDWEGDPDWQRTPEQPLGQGDQPLGGTGGGACGEPGRGGVHSAS